MSWFVFDHNLGGDRIVVETSSVAVAEDVVVASCGGDYTFAFVDDGCEHGCGPAWSLREGDGADGAHLSAPARLEDELGARPDGSPRTRRFAAADVAAFLGEAR